MQDELKKYVDSHRDELDLYQPREQLWDGIDERLRKTRNVVRWRWLAAAATLTLLLSCGTWLLLSERQQKMQHVATVPSKLNETEVYFTAIMQMKDAELDQYCRPQPELCREFELDLDVLQKDYRQLKGEYNASSDKQAILRAMASNLQMQVQLINEQLRIMATVQQQKEKFKTI
jgi:hypothetical protein